MRKIIKQIFKKLGFEIKRMDQPGIRGSLNDIEQDFIEFFSIKRKHSKEEIKSIFLETRNRFAFAGSQYRQLCDDIHNLFKIQYDDSDEKDLVDSYKFHELLHLFRMISYSYNRDFKGEAEYLTKLADKSPIICVDYGCGLGYLSHAICKRKQESEIYLVDIDSLILEFAKFRFEKQNFEVKIIPVSKNNVYPVLPMHNICIAEEVMEHLKQPLIAYQHIYESLEKGGILRGCFMNHGAETFHVSPDLSLLREQLSRNFKMVGRNCYKKL